MGCHTWFAKKVDAPLTDEEIRAKARKVVNEELSFLNRGERGEKLPKWLRDILNGQDLKYRRKYYTNILKKMDNGKLKQSEYVDVMGSTHLKGYRYFDGLGWYCVEGVPYHDVFRKYGYPDTKLRSKTQTMRYVKNPRTRCVIYPYTFEQLESFWNEYPDGIIYFG